MGFKNVSGRSFVAGFLFPPTPPFPPILGCCDFEWSVLPAESEGRAGVPQATPPGGGQLRARGVRQRRLPRSVLHLWSVARGRGRPVLGGMATVNLGRRRDRGPGAARGAVGPVHAAVAVCVRRDVLTMHSWERATVRSTAERTPSWLLKPYPKSLFPLQIIPVTPQRYPLNLPLLHCASQDAWLVLLSDVSLC